MILLLNWMSGAKSAVPNITQPGGNLSNFLRPAAQKHPAVTFSGVRFDRRKRILMSEPVAD
jgi:hypothetical protein